MEGSRTLGNLSLAGGPGIRLGPPSWQTQADSRKHFSGAPSRLQSEGCGGVGLWKQAGQLAGWAEAVVSEKHKERSGVRLLGSLLTLVWFTSYIFQFTVSLPVPSLGPCLSPCSV